MTVSQRTCIHGHKSPPDDDIFKVLRILGVPIEVLQHDLCETILGKVITALDTYQKGFSAVPGCGNRPLLR